MKCKGCHWGPIGCVKFDPATFDGFVRSLALALAVGHAPEGLNLRSVVHSICEQEIEDDGAIA